nr:hypothetical protein [uncultured Noviherbaspirillum sp.]
MKLQAAGLKILDSAFYSVNCLYRNGLEKQGDAALLGVYDFSCRRFGAPVMGRKVLFLLRAACRSYGKYQGKKVRQLCRYCQFENLKPDLANRS